MKGAEIPPPFGGKYRQIMVYVDPYKLAVAQISPMDVVNAVNDSNLILPAGDVKMGPYDYYVYSNSLVDNMQQTERGSAQDRREFVGVGERRGQGGGRQPDPIQHRARRRAAIHLHSHHEAGRRHQHHSVVDGVRNLIKHLYDIPAAAQDEHRLFDQSVFVKEAINTVLHEGLIGLVLTSIMILLFLGSLRATAACCSRFRSPRWPRLSFWLHGRHDQHHDPGRNGAGLLARDRQLGHFARKHLPASGNGELPR